MKNINFARLSLFAVLLSVAQTCLFAQEKSPANWQSCRRPRCVRSSRRWRRKVADLALIPPKLNSSPLPQYDYDKLDYGMTIGIERTPKGRLWACWVAGGDSPKAFFVLATSDDRWRDLVASRGWSSTPIRPNCRWIAACWWGISGQTRQGRLWLFFDQSMHMFDGRAGALGRRSAKTPTPTNPSVVAPAPHLAWRDAQ